MSKAPKVSEIEQLLAQVQAGGGVLIQEVADEATSQTSLAPPEQPVVHAQALPVIDPPPNRGAFTIEHRIRITEAWQYPGYAHNSPDWIDRNWIGYADYDPATGIEPGPCLRIPFAEGAIGITICRIGDWVAKQEVLDNDGNSRSTLAVWPREQFERFFINVGVPTHAVTPDPLVTNSLPVLEGLREQDLAPLNEARKEIHREQREHGKQRAV